MQVVAPKLLTLEELIKFDGSDPTQPILLAIRSTIFDVSTGTPDHWVSANIMGRWHGMVCLVQCLYLSTWTIGGCLWRPCRPAAPEAAPSLLQAATSTARTGSTHLRGGSVRVPLPYYLRILQTVTTTLKCGSALLGSGQFASNLDLNVDRRAWKEGMEVWWPAR